LTKRSILIVEDEIKLAELLRDYLEREDFSVSIMGNGLTVAEEVRRNPPDLIMLDLMLPGKDGLAVCREVRAFSQTPIIMVTARVEEMDRLLGLEMGADDYICKPFSPREAVARVKAVLRRSVAQPEEKVIKAGQFMMDTQAHLVTVGGRELTLTPSEFTLLQVMMSRPDRVFSRADLAYKAQGYEFDGYERTIDTHIKNLRKKIAEKSPDLSVIHTVYGIGYKFSLEDD
jgi:two-component system, OmpR family, response regulator BaeR